MNKNKEFRRENHDLDNEKGEIVPYILMRETVQNYAEKKILCVWMYTQLFVQCVCNTDWRMHTRT